MPWRIPGDLKFYKSVTVGAPEEGKQNVVIMGRKTWESIKSFSKNGSSPMPNRLLYIISSSSARDIGAEQFSEQTEVFASLEEAMDSADEDERIRDVFVIGGQKVFETAEKYKEKYCKNIFATRIGQNIEGDTFISKSMTDGFYLKEVSKSMGENGFNYDFTRWVNPKLFGEHFEELERNYLATRHQEFQYLDLIKDVIQNGSKKADRTGVGTVSTFGNMMRFDLSQTFPLLTTKKVFWKGVVEELLWFLRGSTDGKQLSDKGVKIWEGNGSREYLDKLGFNDRREGDLGPVYGFQWRHFGAKYDTCDSDYSGKGVDQIQQVIESLKKNPDSRRHIVSAWNVQDISAMALPPCHVMFQFYVADGKLSCLLYQRSCDLGLGIPFNIASYALLTCLISKVCSDDPDGRTDSRGIRSRARRLARLREPHRAAERTAEKTACSVPSAQDQLR